MSAMSAGGPLGTGALTSAAAHPGGPALAARWPTSLIVALACVFLALVVMALLVIGSLGRQDRSRALRDRIERYGPRHVPAAAESAAGSAEGKVARTAVGLASQLLRSGHADQRLAERLELAGITQTPAEWVLLGGCACALVTAAVTAVGGGILIGLPAGLLVSAVGMRFAVRIRISRRRAAFADQLPDVLQLIAGSLKAGFSLPQALGSVLREDTQPTAGEFSRALAEARVGISLEAALEAVANRMDCDDLRWTVMAIRIQREVGGNLAEVLDTTVGTMRDRASLQRHVRGLTAEGRLSAYILAALPLLIGSWLLISDGTYLRPLYTTVVGLIMLFSGVVLFGLGVLWMRVLIKVEV